MKAPFGWTVVRLMGSPDPSKFKVYKRSCPATAEHFAADLAQYTHPTKRLATEAGERGEFAYKQL